MITTNNIEIPENTLRIDGYGILELNGYNYYLAIDTKHAQQNNWTSVSRDFPLYYSLLEFTYVKYINGLPERKTAYYCGFYLNENEENYLYELWNGDSYEEKELVSKTFTPITYSQEENIEQYRWFRKYEEFEEPQITPEQFQQYLVEGEEKYIESALIKDATTLNTIQSLETNLRTNTPDSLFAMVNSEPLYTYISLKSLVEKQKYISNEFLVEQIRGHFMKGAITEEQARELIEEFGIDDLISV